MDGNKDESERCLELARKYLALGNKGQVLKYAEKAAKLYPPNRNVAKDLMDMVSNASDQPDSSTSSSTRQRTTSANGGVTDETHPQTGKEYTKEQCEAVQRIKKCKDYYEILNVQKDCDEAELKKAYRKLALQFHPDKNRAPGATEAFKAIGNAFAVLSDTDKRRKYDAYGHEDSNSRSMHSAHEEWSDYSHGFEADITPEQLFNMFFGGGFPTGNVSRRQHHHANGTAHTFRRQYRVNEESPVHMLLQLAPIIILIVMSVLSIGYVGDSPYSFSKTSKYPHQMATRNLKVKYFVKEDFSQNYQGSTLKSVEREIENTYVSNLKNECYRERMTKNTMMWRSRQLGDGVGYEKASEMAMPNCELLDKIYS